jgi:PKD repeat protein
MKRILLLTILCVALCTKKSLAQSACAYTHTVSGNTATFNHMWPLALIYVLDSVHFDYGDGTSQTLMAPIPGNSTHTFANAGMYNVCLTRYLHNISQPNVVIACNFCDSVVVAGTSNCIMNASYSANLNGLTGSFVATSTCTGCTSAAYYWDFGDGSGPVTGATATHTYANAGNYVVCLTAVGTTSSGNQCTDSTCTTINVTTQTNCVANALFATTTAGLTASFTNSSSCTSCSSTIYSWNFGDGSAAVSTPNPTHTYSTYGMYTVCLTVYGQTSSGTTCNDSTCSTVTVTGPSSLFNIENNKIAVFPNPATTEIQLSLPNSKSISAIRIIDMIGKEMPVFINKNSNGKVVLNTSNYSKGIYYLQVKDVSNSSYNASFVKQ